MSLTQSAQAKFDRARQQREALERDLLALCDPEEYPVVEETQAATGIHIYRFAKVPPIPEDLSLRIGETLYNFRCSLDHLIWQLVVSEGNTPTHRNEFPIFKGIDSYNRAKRRSLCGVPAGAIPVIDSLQPCHSTLPHDYWWHLWYLHELCNADKHRHLLLARRGVGYLAVGWYGSEPSPAPDLQRFDKPVDSFQAFLRISSSADMRGVVIRPTILVRFGNPPQDIRADLTVERIMRLIEVSVRVAFNRLSPFLK